MSSDPPEAVPPGTAQNISLHDDASVGVIGDQATYNDHRSYDQRGINITPRRAVTWPVVVGAAPPQASAYQTRWTILERLAEQPSGGSAVVMAGGGGVGKTQIAAGLFHDSTAALRVWVPAGSREEIVATYAAAALRLDLADRSDPADEAAEVFLAFLSSANDRWFVVLDDVTDPGHLHLLAPGGRNGQVLITTRRHDAALSGDGRRVVNVGVYTDGESRAYLTERLTSSVTAADYPPSALDEAGQLADDLGHLPLALAQAAAVILNDGISVAAYRNRFNDRHQSLRELFPASAPADSYRRTVATTWALAMDAANQLTLIQPVPRRRWIRRLVPAAPRPLAQPLAELIAVLDPAGSPESLYTSVWARDYLAEAAETAEVNEEQARQALRALWRLSLITHQLDGNPRAIRMHGLTARAVTDAGTSVPMVQLTLIAASALQDVWPETENQPGLSDALRANTMHLTATQPDALWAEQSFSGGHPVLYTAGRSLGESGQVHQAVTYWTELTDEAAIRLGVLHPGTLTAEHGLAHWFGQAGDPAEAARRLQALLPQYLEVFGPDYPGTFSVRSNLALYLELAGSSNLAGHEYQALLADQSRVLGSDHADTLVTRSNFAGWHRRNGSLRVAAEQYRAVLSDRLQVLGADHPETLVSRSNLASLLGEAGDRDGASQEYEQLLRDMLRVLGPYHPDTFIARSNSASNLGAAGNTSEAIRQLEQLLSDMLQILGPDHPDTLTARHNLAQWVGESGKPEHAADQYETLVEDRRRVLGPNHLDTIITRANLASYVAQAGDPQKAVAQYRQILTDLLTVVDADHPYVQGVQNSLSRWTAQVPEG